MRCVSENGSFPYGFAVRSQRRLTRYHLFLTIEHNEVKRPGGTVRNIPHPEQTPLKLGLRGVIFIV